MRTCEGERDEQKGRQLSSLTSERDSRGRRGERRRTADDRPVPLHKPGKSKRNTYLALSTALGVDDVVEAVVKNGDADHFGGSLREGRRAGEGGRSASRWVRLKIHRKDSAHARRAHMWQHGGEGDGTDLYGKTSKKRQIKMRRCRMEGKASSGTLPGQNSRTRSEQTRAGTRTCPSLSLDDDNHHEHLISSALDLLQEDSSGIKRRNGGPL